MFFIQSENFVSASNALFTNLQAKHCHLAELNLCISEYYDLLIVICSGTLEQ